MNYLIYGEEKYLIDKEINEIIKKNNIDDNSIYKFNMEEITIEELVNSLNTYDLFSNKKLLIADNSLFLTSNNDKNYNLDLLIQYVKNPNDLSILILCVNDNKIDERKKINKELKTCCNIIKCEKLNDYNLESYIKNLFVNNNYKIDKNALNEFVFLVNKDLYSVNNEVKKLMMYKYNNKVINIEDVRNMISRKINDDVFLFVDSVMNNDKRKMFEIYKDLVEYHNEEIIKLINLIYNQFRLTFQVSVLKRMGKIEDEIAKSLNVHPYRVKLIYRKTNINESKLIEYIYELCKLDLDIKTGNTNKIVGFELFLLSI